MLPSTLIEAYEQSRAQATAGELTQGYGAAVLLHHGLCAWALAWQKITILSPSPALPTRPRSLRLSASLDHAVVQVLAGMVLSVQKERCHGSGTGL
jgi:hypothetical protein